MVGVLQYLAIFLALVLSLPHRFHLPPFYRRLHHHHWNLLLPLLLLPLPPPPL